MLITLTHINNNLIIRNEILDSLGKQINKVKEKRTILEKIIRLFTKHKRITAKQNKQKFIVPFK